MSDRVRPAATPMEPFPPTVDVAPGDGVATVATVFPDLAGPAEGSAESAEQIEAVRAAAYEEGVAAGRAAAEQEIATPASALVAAIEEVTQFRAGMLDRYQSELLELALGIARKVVQRELAEKPEHWLGMIREAVQQTLDRERIHIRAGRVLHGFLAERLPELRTLLEGVQELDLLEDETLAENGCVLESRSGDLDLGVDSQIGAIRTALTRSE